MDLWDRVSDAATRAPFDRVDLLMHAALHAEGPEPSRSVAYVREAIGLVDAATDPQRAGLLHERLGQYSLAALDETTALAAYREGVRLVPAAPDSSTRSWVLSGLGRCYADIYQPAEAVAACQEALAVARAAGAKEVETRALVPLGHSLVLLGEVEAGLATLLHARRVATELGAIAEAAGAWTWFVGSLLDAGRFEEAAAAGLEAEGYASLHGLGARWAPAALFYRAAALFHLGNWGEAMETLTRARQYELPGPMELSVDALRLLIEALQGRFASANRRAARVRELAEKHGSWFTGALPQLALSQGDLLTVRKEVETILGDPDVRGRQVGWPAAFGLAAEAEMAALARSRLDESNSVNHAR